jgi:hypothetical protein
MNFAREVVQQCRVQRDGALHQPAEALAVADEEEQQVEHHEEADRHVERVLAEAQCARCDFLAALHQCRGQLVLHFRQRAQVE